MESYKTKTSKYTGSDYRDIERAARKSYNVIAKLTKRNAYVRSVYFGKEKIFVKHFWDHLNQKSRLDRKRRLRLFDCAIELLRHSILPPETRQNPHNLNEILHRFKGLAPDGEVFYVHVKQDNRSGNKFFLSVYPENKRSPRQ